MRSSKSCSPMSARLSRRISTMRSGCGACWVPTGPADEVTRRVGAQQLRPYYQPPAAALQADPKREREVVYGCPVKLGQVIAGLEEAAESQHVQLGAEAKIPAVARRGIAAGRR